MAFILIPLIDKWEKALKEAEEAGVVKLSYEEKGEQE